MNFAVAEFLKTGIMAIVVSFRTETVSDPAILMAAVRLELVRRNWSSVDLGDASGYSPRTIQNEFSRGFRSKRFRRRIAETLGIQPAS